MSVLSPEMVTGDTIRMLATDPRHFGVHAPTTGADGRGNGEVSFGNLLMKALEGVNGRQQTAMELSQAMIVNPDSVDVHDVTIALANANLSLSIAKAVLDRGIRAYREIISIR